MGIRGSKWTTGWVTLILTTLGMLACSSGAADGTRDDTGGLDVLFVGDGSTTDSSLPDVKGHDARPDPVDALADSADPDVGREDWTPFPDTSEEDVVGPLDTSGADLPPADDTFDAGGGHDTGTPGLDVHPDDGALFDMGAIVDPTTAECTFTKHRTGLKDGILVDIWDVSYRSWDLIDGEPVPITIRGFAAKPASASADIPGIVQAHGLGGCAKESHATGPAALLGSFIIAYSGPGGAAEECATSEGLSAGYDSGYRMFDTLDHPGGSWFLGHARAALRAVTCLETRPEVDRNRLGMTGYSGGAVATLIASAVDARIKVAVPLSGTLAWDVAVEAANAWQHGLLAQPGLDTSAAEWTALVDAVDPATLFTSSNAQVMMINGSTDEFFPLTAHMATWYPLPGDKRLSFSANYDHGCYSLSGVEDAGDIEARAALRSAGGQRAWFGHWFGTDGDFTYIPATPILTVDVVGAVTLVAAAVDGGGSKLSVERVHFWYSVDDSLIYQSVELSDQGSGLWGETVMLPLPAGTVSFVDVQYKTNALVNPHRFSLSSEPVIPAGHVPAIRSSDNCLP